MRTPPVGTVGDRYRSSRLRTTDLLSVLGTDEWATPVPTCPGWSVHDVLSHLVGVAEDALSGRITGPPPPEVTAEEVARHAGDDPVELLAAWGELAPSLEAALSQFRLWPGFFDALAHEHDVRGALGTPGARDHDDVDLAAELLVRDLALPVALELDLGGRVVEPAGCDGPPLRVATSSYEVFRFRLGRRSRAQVAALDWSGDPGPVLDRLFIFGPAEVDVAE